MDQASLTTDGIHFYIIEGQAWFNQVFQERLDEMEVELIDTGVLKKEETSNKPAISTFVTPNLEKSLANQGKKRTCKIIWGKRPREEPSILDED